MAATAPQELLTEGRCFNCYGASAVQMMRLSLLANILTTTDPTAMTDPQSLLDYGKCFNCYGASMVDMMELALLDQILIAGGGGGGGSSGNLSDFGSPVGVVTPTALYQWYRDKTNDTYWWAMGLTSADWHQAL